MARLLFALFVLLAAPLADAADLRVPSEFGSVDEALEAAQACDRILLAPGTYEGTWFIDKDVLLMGDGAAGDVILDGDEFGNALSILQGARVANLTITGAARGIDMFGPWTEVDGVRFEGLQIGVLAADASGRIHDSVFTDISVTGIDANRSALWIDDNTFVDVPVAIEIIRGEGRILRAEASGSGWGARVSQSRVDVIDSTFHDGDTGVFLQGGTTDVLGCRFVNNALGVHVFDADTTVLDSDLEGNGVGVLTTFADARILGNRVSGSTEVAVQDGIGSASLVASNLLVDNRRAAFLQLADTTWRNNTVLGGADGILASGGAPVVRSSIFTGLSGVAIDGTAAPGMSAAWNLFWEVGVGQVGIAPDGSDVTADPLLDGDALPSVASPALDGGDPTPGAEDPDGSRADLGHSGGPDADARWQPAPPGPPVFEEQSDYGVPEGWWSSIFVGPYSDPNHDPLRVTWDRDASDGLDFCDAVGGTLEVAPPDDGDWPVWVRVEDPDGNVAEIEIQVTASNEPPEVWWELEAAPLESVQTSFFVDVFDPSPEDTHTVDIFIDADAEPDIRGALPGFIPWTPEAEGVYQITVRVTDDDGAVVDVTSSTEVGARPSTPLGDDDCSGCSADPGTPAGAAPLLLLLLAWPATRRRSR